MPIPAAVPIAIGAISFLKYLSNNSANSEAMDKGYEALNQAQKSIQGAADKAISLNAPYMENAGPDFQRQRGLVQSGYYQTPYGQSFTPQQFASSGFTMNPSQGMASFQPQSFQLNSFTPQGLPPLPPMPQQAPQQPQANQMPPINMGDATKRAISESLLRSRMQPPAMGTSWTAMGAPTVSTYNPQTGQNSPLVDIGAKPPDPRLNDPMELLKMRMASRWRFGGSGPLEGGLPQYTLPGRGLI